MPLKEFNKLMQQNLIILIWVCLWLLHLHDESAIRLIILNKLLIFYSQLLKVLFQNQQHQNEHFIHFRMVTSLQA